MKKKFLTLSFLTLSTGFATTVPVNVHAKPTTPATYALESIGSGTLAIAALTTLDHLAINWPNYNNDALITKIAKNVILTGLFTGALAATVASFVTAAKSFEAVAF